MPSATLRHLLLGVAGHVDHGKTSLVRSLTGEDTDRLPEERERGVSIDLGFAPLDLGEYRIGVVDVPGHHRFVRNMLAGASGVDLAMLVVAADDGVMPQTEEHLEILQHMRLEAGVIALSKCDLVEPDWLDLVEEEVRQAVSATFLADAPLVRTAFRGAQGRGTLRDALTNAAAEAWERRPPRDRGRFLMAVDRSFAVPGHGAVVTGYVARGEAATGDELEVLPVGAGVRIRGLQSHSQKVDAVEPGMRAAVNLSGVRYTEVARGDWLASPGTKPTKRFATVELEVSPRAPKALKTRTSVHLHVGAADVMARVVLPDRKQVEPGERCFAQLLLAKPTLLTWGQPFVLRAVSPAATLGGGRVLAPHATRSKRLPPQLQELLADLAGESPARRLAAAAFFAGYRGVEAGDVDTLAGIGTEDAVSAIEACPELAPRGERWLHRDIARRVDEKILDALSAEHESTPLRHTIEASRLAQHVDRIENWLVEATVASLEAAGRIKKESVGVALSDWRPRLSAQQQDVLEQALESYKESAANPPSVAALAERLGQDNRFLAPLLELAAERGDLVRVSREIYVASTAMETIIASVSERLANNAGLRASDIRQLLDTSRKVVVPLCEHLDAIGVSRRVGDLRFPGNSSQR